MNVADTHGIALDRLRRAMLRSRMVLQVHRENRREAVRLAAGNHWSEDGSQKAQPLNLLSMYQNIVVPALVAKEPRLMMATFNQELKPVVSAMQDWANKRLKQMYFARVMQRCVLDGLYGVGIGHVALTNPGQAELGGYAKKAGEPSFCSKDLDDMVWDVHARCFEEVSFIGHRYRSPIDRVKDSKFFDSARLKVEPTADSAYDLETGDEMTGALGKGSAAGSDEEFLDYVELWEIYIPGRRLVVTLCADLEEPLSVKPWVGPDCGPYHILRYGDVPGNLYPKAPVMDLLDLHETVNGLLRKLIVQGQRQKNLGLVPVGSEDDAKAITAANDGQWIKCDNPERAKEIGYGGPNNQNLAFMLNCKEQFDFQAGNMSMLGGLGAQSPTLGQDQMLEKNASRMMQDRQDKTIVFAREVSSALAWYWWKDPLSTMRVSVAPIAGAPDLVIDRKVTPEQRAAGQFEDLDVDIDPYSMAPDTPQSRMNLLMQIVMQVVMPMQPSLEKAGLGLDVAKFLSKLARYGNMPDLEEILGIGGTPDSKAPPEEEGGADYTSTAPATTTRNYVRRGVSSKTQQSGDQQLMQSLMAQGPGPNGAMGKAA